MFRYRLHLPRPYALYVHVRQRSHQRLLTPLIPLEYFGPEPSPDVAALAIPTCSLALAAFGRNTRTGNPCRFAGALAFSCPHCCLELAKYFLD
jgi:hypothetical protein